MRLPRWDHKCVQIGGQQGQSRSSRLVWGQRWIRDDRFEQTVRRVGRETEKVRGRLNRQRQHAPSGWQEEAERMGTLRHAWQPLGMVLGLVRRVSF